VLSEEIKQQRLNYITGTDAAIICNKSPFKTPYKLWLEKTGREEADDISELNHIKYGNFFEDGVAKWFEHESGKEVLMPDEGMIFHPKMKFMAGNIDRLLKKENAILECKTAYTDKDGWGNGENVIPDYYLMQVAHYCITGNFDKAYIAVVFSLTREMRWYEYERNQALEDKIIEHERRFWEHNIQEDIAPDPQSIEDIIDFYKVTKSDPVVANSEIVDDIEELKEIKKNAKELDTKEDELKLKIFQFMKDHDTLLAPNGKKMATWKFTKPIQRFDSTSFKSKHPDLYESFRVPGKRSRRFTLSRSKKS